MVEKKHTGSLYEYEVFLNSAACCVLFVMTNPVRCESPSKRFTASGKWHMHAHVLHTIQFVHALVTY